METDELAMVRLAVLLLLLLSTAVPAGCYVGSPSAGVGTRSGVPTPLPAQARPRPDGSCPVTAMANAQPPDANTASLTRTWWTDGVIWAGLVPPYAGRWYASDRGLKVGWWRSIPGQLQVTGTRIDGAAPPLRADIPSGYGPVGFQASGIVIPTAGCWEIQARVNRHQFRFVIQALPASENPRNGR